MSAKKEPAPGKVPVLLLATPADARALAGSARELAWTVTDDLERARALASTGGYVAVFGVAPLASSVPNAIELDPTVPVATTASLINERILRASEGNEEDQVGALPYDEYIELARYATTRRYLISLLQRHHGSVTDAARGAAMKRESLHRLLRRHHLIADDFRDR